MSMHVRYFPSLASLNRAAADLLAAAFEYAGGGSVGVMLSGGTTPLAVYADLVANGVVAGQGVSLLYSDERAVPADDPESNYGATRPLIRSLGVPESRVIRVRTELGWEASADRYHRDLEAFFVAGGRIPLGLLGLGGGWPHGLAILDGGS